jgi:hypothetical protein
VEEVNSTLRASDGSVYWQKCQGVLGRVAHPFNLNRPQSSIAPSFGILRRVGLKVLKQPKGRGLSCLFFSLSGIGDVKIGPAKNKVGKSEKF